MNTPQARARAAQRAAQAACLGILIFAGSLAQAAQHGGAGQRVAPHWQARQQQFRPQQHPEMRQNRPQQGQPYRPAQPQYRQQYPAQAPQRAYGNGPVRQQPNPYGQSAAPGNQGSRADYNGTPYAVSRSPQAAGHLPQWMAQHQNLPVGQQEKLLRQEPGFNRLNPGEQEREVQQLHRLNQLPEAQRDRRLARAEAIEHLTPAERMQVNQSARELSVMPPDRQAMVRHAFQDLRGVPVDQRDTMLNSARYGAAFSPQERSILSNLLRVEPYEGPR